MGLRIFISEDHLGGYDIGTPDHPYGTPGTYTPKLWNYIIDRFNVNSVIDVGCGFGYSLQEFAKVCRKCTGIEGSPYAIKNSPVKELLVQHDYTTGAYSPKVSYDLCWSCEFVEHVEEQYSEHFLATFRSAKYLAMTFALPGQHGYHHVNCQPQEYWVSKIEEEGFKFNLDITEELRSVASREAQEDNTFRYFQQTGLFFTNLKYV